MWKNEDRVGYVYMYTHKESKKWYLGSHYGETQDLSYTGSGTYWQRAKNKYGIESFEFKILYTGNYFREMEEFLLNEFDAQNSIMSYNLKNEAMGGSFPGTLNGMYGKKLTPEQSYKCGNAFRGKKRKDHSEKMKGENNPRYGQSKHTHGLLNFCKNSKGKTLEEIHGVEKAKEISNKLSKALKGVPKPYLSEKYKGQGNPFYNKKHSKETKEKMSNVWNCEERRKIHKDAMKKNAEKKRGIIPKQLYVKSKCIHCSFEGTTSNITKWHNVNCKLNPENPENVIGSFQYIKCPHCNFSCNTNNSNSRRNFKVYHMNNCKHKTKD